MKKPLFHIAASFVILLIVFLMNACKVSEKANTKSGAQLWGENCGRCHNAPGPGEFRNSNWDVIGQHMRVRANLTGTDTEKIIGFLKGS
jgi:mono/diheme cytochrome c family protein